MFRPTTLFMTALPLIALTGCIDTGKIAVKTTSKILVKAMPSTRMENDYVHASRALPGTLKTVEGFHTAYPDNKRLTRLLAEGYCQYGTGFVEDEWEVAHHIEKDYKKADEIAERATRMFIRCMNYSLELLGKEWTTKYTGPVEDLKPLARKAGSGQRFAMQWAALGLGSSINMNKDDVGLIDMIATAEFMLKRLVVMDGDGDLLKPTDPKKLAAWDQAAFDKEFGKAGKTPKDPILRAMPHIGLGLLYSSRGEAVGGDPDQGKRHLERAIELTEGKYLLPKVLLARNYGRIRTDREFFRKLLVEVLQTDPAVFPEQRLANEIAHRRARRYLKLEKEWF